MFVGRSSDGSFGKASAKWTDVANAVVGAGEAAPGVAAEVAPVLALTAGALGVEGELLELEQPTAARSASAVNITTPIRPRLVLNTG